MTAFFEALGRLARGLGSLLPPCPIHTFTGYPCPSCGVTRAVIALAEGRWLDAFLLNPLMVGGGALFFGYVGIGLLVTARTGHFPEPRLTRRGLQYLRVSVIAIVLLNWWWLIRSGV